MKYFFLIATIVLQVSIALTLKLLDNFDLIIMIFIISLSVGGLINFSKNQIKIKNVGWGLFYGSLTSLGIVLIFMIWL